MSTHHPALTAIGVATLLVMSVVGAGCGDGPATEATDGGGFVDPRFEDEEDHQRSSDPVPMHVPAAEPLRLVIGDVLETPASAHSGHTTFVVYNASQVERVLTLSGAGQEPPSSRTIPAGETFEFDLTLEPGELQVDAGEGYTGTVTID